MALLENSIYCFFPAARDIARITSLIEYPTPLPVLKMPELTRSCLQSKVHQIRNMNEVTHYTAITRYFNPFSRMYFFSGMSQLHPVHPHAPVLPRMD
jgi:hypothetical protein